MKTWIAMAAMLAAVPALAQTTRPATRPAGVAADAVLNRMLNPRTAPGNALQPLPDAPAADAKSGSGAVAPGAPSVNVLREGTYIVDRTGRLTRGNDGSQWEFAFDADGKTLADPPLVILPNIKLAAMENMLTQGGRDLRFRITGIVTEYRGRNYILLEKVVVVPEIVNPLK